MSRLVLASASPVRARLLRSAGVAFDIVPAAVDEDAVKESLLAEGIPPAGIADALAELKALRVSAGWEGGHVLGADQVLVLDGQLLGKPASREDASAQLRLLRDREHILITAMVLARDGTAIWRHLAQSRLRMRDFSEGFLEEYLEREGDHVLGSVGSYRLEGPGVQLFERVEGDYFSVLGLSLVPLLAELRELGVLPR